MPRVTFPAHSTAPVNWRRWLRGPVLALLLVVGVLLAGTLGFALIEGWSTWDAFYMTLTTVTTLGYQVRPLSPAGQAFNVALIIVGVSTVLYTLSLLMALIIEGELHERWEQRRRKRMQNQLTEHFIVCGFGRIGSIIAVEFTRQRVPFLIIESDASRAQAAIDAGYLALAGDATSEELLLTRAGIARARGLIAAVGTDAENVYIVLTARLIRPDLFIVGRAESEEAQRKLVRAGADRVISPYQIGALHIVQTALRPAVVDFVQLATSSENLELAMEQVKIIPASELAGRSILQANLRQRFRAIVVAIQRASGHMEFNPSPDTVMHAGDHLVVLGPPDSLRELEVIAGRAGATVS